MIISYQRLSIEHRLQTAMEHCVLAMVFLLPLSVHAATFFLTAGALAWLGNMLVSRHMRIRTSPFDGLVLLFVLVSAVSVWASPDRAFSYYNYYHLMSRYIVMYYLVIHSIHSFEQVKRLIVCLFVSALLVALFGFYQYLQGMDVTTLQWVDGDRFPDLKTRVFSTLHNPNLLAGFLVSIMAIAAGMALCSQTVRVKGLLFGLTIILGLCLILTYSRGAWLSVFAVIATYGVVRNRKIFWLFLVLPALFLAAKDGVTDRMLSILDPTDTSAALRFALWESTLAMIANHPVSGIGWGAYWLVYPHYDFFIQNAQITIFHAHNMYLHLAAEIGIPGLLVFLAILAGHVRLAGQIARSGDNPWIAGIMLGLLSALLGLAAGGLTDYVMYSIQISMLFWMLLAITIAVYHLRSNQKN